MFFELPVYVYMSFWRLESSLDRLSPGTSEEEILVLIRCENSSKILCWKIVKDMKIKIFRNNTRYIVLVILARITQFFRKNIRIILVMISNIEVTWKIVQISFYWMGNLGFEITVNLVTIIFAMMDTCSFVIKDVSTKTELNVSWCSVFGSCGKYFWV